jgi:pimeloyl-ACP methyl ester carboxylesterase
MSPITEHILERAGSRIHYWLSGPEGRPLVALTHGATMDHRMFDAQVPALAAEYRVLTWDVRGHGQSQPIGDAFSIAAAADDLLALVSATGHHEAVLVGQSMGGYIAQEAIFRHPEQARALVTIGVTGMTLPYPRSDRWLLALTPMMVRLWPYEHLKRTTARTTALTAEARAYAYDAMSQVSKGDVAAIMNAVGRGLHPEPGYRIPIPALLTHGDQDTAGRIRDYAQRWADSEPNARYVVIPDAGHNANQDNAVFFNRLLLDFLHQHVPA